MDWEEMQASYNQRSREVERHLLKRQAAAHQHEQVRTVRAPRRFRLAVVLHILGLR